MKIFFPNCFLLLLVLLHIETSATRIRTLICKKMRLYNSAAPLSEIITPQKPKWAGGGPVSDLVNFLISLKPVFSLMKLGARRVLISTAEKNNIPWTSTAVNLAAKNDILVSHYNSLFDPEIQYPDYYTKDFHAYDDGNLNWEAAYECESATMAMALRVWPTEALTAVQAQTRLRQSFLSAVKSYMGTDAAERGFPRRIADVGCSVGVSTSYIAKAFPSAEVLDGIDLSPHFLAVAKLRQPELAMQEGLSSPAVRWIHTNMERSGLPTGQYDLTCVCFVFHELPQEASRNIIAELYRVANSGGVVAITDNNPMSAVIQNLPPALFTLMKATEPWSDQYYVFDLEAALRDVGFVDVRTVETDPRHRTVLARKPATDAHTYNSN